MWKTLLGWIGGDPVAPYRARLSAIEEEGIRIQELSNEQIKEESLKLKEETREKKMEIVDEILPHAFALARETAWRTLRQRPYDVQMIGGMVLVKGAIAEMMTGEGKTLTAVAPVYTQALLGKGVHVVTVNEYLARRDTVWMGEIYHALGISIACLVPQGAFLYDPDWKVKEDETKHVPGSADDIRDTQGSFLVEQDFLRPISRREAYLADVTYGTNHEFGFDYLRDHLVAKKEDQVQRGHGFAVIDEVDSILIDEARTPLIISAPDEASSEYYKTFARIASGMTADRDFTVDEKRRQVAMTDEGISRTEKILGIQNLYDPANFRLVHYLEESVRAYALYHKDKEYVVRNGEVIIVDEFTGRMLQGRRYNGGLHQAIEAKEGVFVKQESRTYAKISIQNYFRMYEKISGMTGTAQTSAEEFHKVYGLEVISIPPNKPCVRKDENDLVYQTAEGKWQAVAEEVKARHATGQPILVGTTSIEKSEALSARLSRMGISHEVLNAKQNEREGSIIAQAGKKGAVTVATNLAGRGVDILLGGNPPEEPEKVKESGGLHVIGTERHEARRIDNQLRGRAGRQGDPGSSRFFLSLEDDLLRIFNGDRIKSIMTRLNVPEDQPIELGLLSRAVEEAQSKVEGAHFDSRKHLLEYDDVLNKQRAAVYHRRNDILVEGPQKTLADAAIAYLERLEASNLTESDFAKLVADAGFHGELETQEGTERAPEHRFDALREKIIKTALEAAMHPDALRATLSVLDGLWMDHLENLDALSESVGLRAYGQHDPLAEYRNEAKRLYDEFWTVFDTWALMNMQKIAQAVVRQGGAPMPQPSSPALQKQEAYPGTGRNDPCPCGSGKKYKKCHGA